MSEIVGKIKSMNILAIGSHPDDIEIGCGGTLQKLKRLGHHIYLMVMTEGSLGGDPAVRRKEQELSAKRMKADALFWGKFDDTHLPQNQQTIQAMEKIVKKVKPAFVFVHHSKDTHQDHRHVHENAVVASRHVDNVLFYEGPTSFDFTPHVFVDLSNDLNPKLAALSCHASQIDKTNVRRHSILDIARATATFRGTQCHVTYAEAFVALRMFIML